MSHVIDYAPDAVEQKLRDLRAVMLACACTVTKSGKPALRLRLMQGCEIGADGHLYRDGHRVAKGNAHYRTWKDDHRGRLVGDWDVPRGMTEADVGDNAVAVIEVTEEGRQELGGRNPYEVGVIPHTDPATGELTYSLVHDFYGGGMGIETYVGATEVDRTKKVGAKSYAIKSAHGDFLMYYQMMCAKLAAEEAGHDIEFTKLADGTYEAVVDAANKGMVAQ